MPERSPPPPPELPPDCEQIIALIETFGWFVTSDRLAHRWQLTATRESEPPQVVLDANPVFAAYRLAEACGVNID